MLSIGPVPSIKKLKKQAIKNIILNAIGQYFSIIINSFHHPKSYAAIKKINANMNMAQAIVDVVSCLCFTVLPFLPTYYTINHINQKVNKIKKAQTYKS